MRLFSKRTFSLGRTNPTTTGSAVAAITSTPSTKTAEVPSAADTFGTYQERRPTIDLEIDLQKRSEDEKRPMHNGECFRNGAGILATVDTTKYTKPVEKHWLVRRIYILSWISKYTREMAIADLIAGITLGLTIIPQAIAYANLAGLTSEYGLYSAFVGSIVYVLFGTIPQVSIGPTSLMSLMVLQFCTDKPVQFVIVLTFMAGLVEFLMGVLQLGFIVNFISTPVTKAFTTATAAIIVLVQSKTLLGAKYKGVPTPAEFVKSLKLSDSMVGIIGLIVLLALRKLSQVKFKHESNTTQQLKKILWYISISRNFLVVFFCALISFVWANKQSIEDIPYALSDKVNSTMPTPTLPPFVFDHKGMTYVFTDIVRELGSAIIVVPIVAVLANVAIAKAFVKDGMLDASQEMLTLGLCNLAGSFFSSMPTCGAFTRSAVSQSSGVRTPMAGIYTGIIVLLALSVLTPYFQYIPKATLAAVLIAAVIFMIDLQPVKQAWRENKKDFFCWTICFIVCVVDDVQMGLFVGIVINLICILLRLGNPKLDVSLRDSQGVNYIYITPLSDVYYTGVDALRTEIRSACALYRNEFPLVLDCSRFMQFDATFVEMLNSVAKELNDNNVMMMLHRLPLRMQQHLPSMANIQFCNDEITADDFSQKK